MNPEVKGGEVGVSFSWSDLSIEPATSTFVTFAVEHGRGRIEAMEKG
jgi:hypothetical protein